MFNNGFNNYYPYQNFGYRQGLFSALRGKFNWSSILSNTQKTLNIINQAIPVFYQIRPIWNNTKTIFKIMNAVKDDDNSKTVTRDNTNKNITNHINDNVKDNNTNHSFDNAPSFFL